MDSSFLSCSDKNAHDKKPISYAKKNYLIKIIKNGSLQVHNEVAALNSEDIYRSTGYLSGALGAWRNSSHYFLLLHRKDANLKSFIEYVKEYWMKENETYKLQNSIIETFAIQMIKQLNTFEQLNVAHGDIKCSNILVLQQKTCMKFCYCDYGLRIKYEKEINFRH